MSGVSSTYGSTGTSSSGISVGSTVAERALNRKIARQILKENGARNYGQKKKRRTKRRSYRRSYRRRPTVSFPGNVTMGLGAYKAPRSAAFGESAASSLASMLPYGLSALAPLAGKAGGWLGNKIGSWLGLGAYELNRNSIVIDEGNTPTMMHSNDDTIIVRHREYVGEVYSAPVAGDFTVSNFALQPGNSALFEWLAPIANQYQEWIPMGIVAEFKSNSGEVVSGANNALGQVIMATDYNAYNQNPFTNKSQMNNTVYSTNAKITQSFVHAIECDPRKNVQESFFIRPGPVPAGQPPQLYDLGTFAIASHGCQGVSQDLGELWMSYEIGLRKATLVNTDAGAIATDIFYTDANIRLGATLNEYWRGSLPAAANSIGCTISADGNVLSFPKDLEQGRFHINMRVNGSAQTATGGGPTQSDWAFTATNCTILPFFPGGTLYSFGAQLGANAIFSSQSVDFVVAITGNNARLTAGTATALAWPQANATVPSNGFSMLTVITKMNMNIAIP